MKNYSLIKGLDAFCLHSRNTVDSFVTYDAAFTPIISLYGLPISARISSSSPLTETCSCLKSSLGYICRTSFHLSNGLQHSRTLSYIIHVPLNGLSVYLSHDIFRIPRNDYIGEWSVPFEEIFLVILLQVIIHCKIAAVMAATEITIFASCWSYDSWMMVTVETSCRRRETNR